MAAAQFPIGASATIETLADDPHPLLARLRAHEPVSYLPALDTYLVTRRDLALAVMRDDETYTVDDPRFTTARVIGPSMLSRDGDEHARHRDPFARPWRLDAIRSQFTAFVGDEAARLVAAVRPAGEGELRRALAGPLAARSMQVALGLERLETAAVLAWYDAIVAAVSEVTTGLPLPAAGTTAYAALRDAVRSTVAASAPTLTPDEAASNAAVLLFGGIETTEGMIASLLSHLLADEAALAAVLDDRSLLANAVEESLRLEPAAAVIDRYATADAVLDGVAIPAGALVTVSLAGANRDPAVWDDPDRFDLGRPNARLHVAFAQGPHVCLGMHLARLEAVAAVTAVLDALPDLGLDRVRTTAPSGLVFRKPASVWATWTA